MYYSFNPRTHTGCDYEEVAVYEGFDTVSIHAPTRGATLQEVQSELSPFVSIHAPTRGATKGSGRILGPVRVSIHAPTRGATSGKSVCIISTIVSIHAPTRGATRVYRIYRGSLVFQSTHPHGVRLFTIRFIYRRIGVSIHAPTRGATMSFSKDVHSII